MSWRLRRRPWRARQAVELRQNTPFVGLLSEDEQRAILAAFAESHRAGRLATA